MLGGTTLKSKHGTHGKYTYQEQIHLNTTHISFDLHFDSVTDYLERKLIRLRCRQQELQDLRAGPWYSGAEWG